MDHHKGASVFVDPPWVHFSSANTTASYVFEREHTASIALHIFLMLFACLILLPAGKITVSVARSCS